MARRTDEPHEACGDEEMVAHRGVDASYATIGAWTVKFGPKIAATLGRSKLPPSPRWHPDKLVPTIAGECG
jgi:transposase-like protein